MRTYFLFFLFVLFLHLIYRFTLPFGDEPDFYFRINDFISSEISHFFIYRSLYESAYYANPCVVEWNAMSIWGSIRGSGCDIDIKFEFIRWVNEVLLLLILFILYFFIRSRKINFLREKELSIFFSFLMPSVVYYMGVVGLEAIILSFALFLILFESYVKKFFLILPVWYLDQGSFILILSFIFYSYFLNQVIHRFGVKVYFIISLSVPFLSYLLGISLLSWLSNFPVLNEKANLIYSAYTGVYSYVYDNYPILLRPFVTLLTASFMLPSGLKSIVVNLLVFFVFFKLLLKSIDVVFFKSLHDDENIREAVFYFITPLSFIVSFVFVLPGFANAKYYVFLMPFFIYAYIRFFGYKYMALYMISMNLIVFSTLLLLRVF